MKGCDPMYRKWRKITCILDILSLVVIFPFYCFMRGNETVGAISIVVAALILLVSLILNIIKCRCPECGRYISERYYPFSSYEHCPHCGADLNNRKHQ